MGERREPGERADPGRPVAGGWGGYGAPPGYPGGDAHGDYRSDLGGAPTREDPGPYRGVGPRGFRRSDARIEEDLCERLTEHDRIDAADLEVRVRDGVVALSGTVADHRQRRLVEEVVDACAGVRDIDNGIRVREPGLFDRIGDALTADEGR